EHAGIGLVQPVILDLSFEACSEKSELHFAFDGAASRAAASRKKDRMNALTKNPRAVVLERVLVDRIRLGSIHGVSAQVIHEVNEKRIREQVKTRPVRKRR